MATFRRTVTRQRPKKYWAPSGVSAGTSAALQANESLIAAAEGDAAWPAVYDTRLNVSVASGKVSAWDDAVGTIGGRAPGPQLAQATAGKRPTFTGVQGSGSEAIDFVSASSTILASGQDSRFLLSGAGNQFCFVIAKVTVAGPVAGMASDPTSASTYPLMAVKPAGTTWKGEFGATAAGNDTAPDTGLAFNDGVVRVVAMGKTANAGISAGRSGDVTYTLLLAGRQPYALRGVTVATTVSGGLKLMIGGLGASYVSATVYWVGYFTGTDIKTAAAQVLSFAQSQFGAVADTSKTCSFVEIGDSLTAGTTSSSPLAGLAGSGTTSLGYVASRTSSGPGTWVAQGLDVGFDGSFNRGVAGRRISDLTATLAAEVSPVFDGLRPRGKCVRVWGGTNDILVDTVSAATALASLATLTAAIRAIDSSIRVVVCTLIDSTLMYTTGTLNALGTAAQAFNAGLRASAPGGIYHDGLIDFEADASTHWTINLSGAKAYTNATYYNADGTHQTDTGYAALGVIEKTFFDANPGLLAGANADSTAAVPFGGLATVAVQDTATSTAALPLGGSVTVGVQAGATSLAAVPLGGAVVATVQVAADSTAALPLGGVITVSVAGGGGPNADSTSALPLAGTATATVLVQAASVSALSFGGVATVGVLVQATSTAAIPLLGGTGVATLVVGPRPLTVARRSGTHGSGNLRLRRRP